MSLATSSGFDTSFDALQVVDSSFTPSHRAQKFSPEAVQQDLASLSSILSGSDQPVPVNDLGRDLFKKASVLLHETVLDSAYFLLNAIAFYGYLIAVLDFFFPRSKLDLSTAFGSVISFMMLKLSSDTAMDLGFLAGDMAWTVEPALALAAPFILNYLQLGVLRKQEEKRQQKAIQARQISEKQDVQLAHNMQFSEFNKSWDKYMEEYDNMAQMYIQQMTERHAIVLLEFQKQLRQDLAGKPPKWSKDLLDQRRKQHINARNKNYTEAQKLKKQSDRHEERERKEMEQSQAIIFQRREAKFRMQQQTELQALLKRIECRRKEHLKQRGLDTKRLLQRNRNVQAVLDTKQAAESQRLFTEIKKLLFSNALLNSMLPVGTQKPGGNTTGGAKKSASSKLLHKYGGYGNYDQNDNGGDYAQSGPGGDYSGFYNNGSPGDDRRGGEDDDEEENEYQGGNVDPEFLKEKGPNFNNLVYNGGSGGNGAFLDGGSSYEEEEDN
eukprot:gene23075-29267_t